jgi:hypothetical protein
VWWKNWKNKFLLLTYQLTIQCIHSQIVLGNLNLHLKASLNAKDVTLVEINAAASLTLSLLTPEFFHCCLFLGLCASIPCEEDVHRQMQTRKKSDEN